MDTTGTGLLNATKPKSKATTTLGCDDKELEAIIKFGAADLFAEQEGDSGDQDLRLDLDSVLEAAETHDTNEAAGGKSDEFLSGFKTVDIETNEEELDNLQENTTEQSKTSNKTDMPTWDEIIPENIRQQAEEEELLRQLREQNLPPRKRTKATPGFPFDATSTDGTGHEDDTNTPRSKKEPLKELLDAKIGSFTPEEVRNVISATRKFGSLEDKFDSIIEEAHVKDRDPREIKRLVRWIREACLEVNSSQFETIFHTNNHRL